MSAITSDIIIYFLGNVSRRRIVLQLFLIYLNGVGKRNTIPHNHPSSSSLFGPTLIYIHFKT
tara:strand:- start:113 stop:298 length:186 start_codon:yes stop_codon:yes gene_type:complete